MKFYQKTNTPYIKERREYFRSCRSCYFDWLGFLLWYHMVSLSRSGLAISMRYYVSPVIYNHSWIKYSVDINSFINTISIWQMSGIIVAHMSAIYCLWSKISVMVLIYHDTCFGSEEYTTKEQRCHMSCEWAEWATMDGNQDGRLRILLKITRGLHVPTY